MGTHQNLIKNNGFYADLIKNQDFENEEKKINSINESLQEYTDVRSFITNQRISLSKSYFEHEELLLEDTKKEKDLENDENEEKIQLGKMILYETLLEKKFLFFTSIASSVVLGVVFPLDGLIMGSFSEMLQKTDSSQLMKKG